MQFHAIFQNQEWFDMLPLALVKSRFLGKFFIGVFKSCEKHHYKEARADACEEFTNNLITTSQKWKKDPKNKKNCNPEQGN